MTDNKIKKVAITGPESTGKSELAKQLAHQYQGDFVSEFARNYIERLDREYSYEDILVIAQNQLKGEQEMLQHAKHYLFSDTELIVTKIWSLHKFGSCHPWIEKQIADNTYDLFLLCNVDLPWQFDKQREHPHLRNYFYEWYKKELDAYGFPYRIVSGAGNNRLENAIDAIDNFFSENE